MASTTPRTVSPVKRLRSQQEVAPVDVNEMSIIDEEDPDHTEQMAAPQTQIKSESQEQTQDEVTEHAPPVVTNERPRRARTPEPKHRRSQRVEVHRSPSSPGRIAEFNWEEFEKRYVRAIQEADENEKEILAEFERLVKYFNVWASAASSHDNERAVKRLQTRARYVHLSEEKLNHKKEHREITSPSPLSYDCIY